MQKELTIETFGVALQALATAKATKQLLIGDSRQKEFEEVYHSLLEEIVNDVLSRLPEGFAEAFRQHPLG